MRIIHVRREFCRLSETFVYDAMRGVADVGHDTHVVCARRINIGSRPFPEDRVHQMRVPGLFDLARVWSDLLDIFYKRPDIERRRWLLALGRTLDRLKPDVVHAHFGKEAVMAATWTRRRGVPLVVSHHGYDLSELLRLPEWLDAYRRMWADAAAITVVSEFQRARLLKLGVDSARLHVLRVGKRLEDYHSPIGRGPVRKLLSVGRLAEKKGHADAIRATTMANAQLPAADQLSLTIIGDGPDESALQQQIVSLGVGEQIKLAGAMPHDQVIAAMKAADAFILCSKTAHSGDEEGVPTVLMEAQAAGLPCVSTRHAGIPEVFDPADQDLLAPEGDVGAVADMLLTLARMPIADRIARVERGRAHIDRHFNHQRSMAQLLDLYAAVVPTGQHRTAHR